MAAIRSMKRAAPRTKKAKPENFHPMMATPGKHPLFDIAAILSGKPSHYLPVKLRLPKRGMTPQPIPRIRLNSPRTPGSKSRNSSMKKQ